MAREVAIITTGGTIATPNDHGADRLDSDDLAATLPEMPHIDITWQEFCNRPSSHLGTGDVLMLIDAAEKAVARGASGVVITHGTDTLEETAYLFSLFWRLDIPAVITGAMRPAGLVGGDGPRNLYTAIQVASSPASRERGPLVVFNDRIYAAAEITKIHSWAVDTFASELGPVGTINQWDELTYSRKADRPSILQRPTSLSSTVGLITASLDTNADLVDAAVAAGFDGLVIAGAGQGSLPPEMWRAVELAASRDVITVIASRCAFGGTSPGTIKTRIIRAGNLNGPKSRLLLMTALNICGRDFPRISSVFVDRSASRG